MDKLPKTNMLLQNLKKSLAAFLIVCVMAPGFYMGMAPAPEANADMASIFGGAVGALAACVVSALMVSAAVHVAGQVLSLLFSVPTNETNVGLLMDNWTTAGMTTTQSFKECILDALAWALKAIIIEVILSAIVDWINKGFEGGPAFLSDPDGFFKKLAFGTLDMFINESGLDALLCAPFKDDVLDTIRTYDARVQIKSYECSLDTLLAGGGTAGYNRMVTDGSVATDGIPGAMILARSGNNPYSTLFNVQAEANDRIARAQGQEKMLLDQGNGFFSLKCDINNDGVMEACTPGNFVAIQLNNWMGGGLKQLEAADEVSEIVSSVVSVLVQKTLFDDKEGLLSGYAKNADGTKRSTADIQKEWADAGYDQNYKPGAEQKYTGSSNTGEYKGILPGTDFSDPPGSCGKVYSTYGSGNGGRAAWRIPRQTAKSVTITFTDGYKVTVPNTSARYAPSGGFVFRPGGGAPGTSTYTSHGGAFIHAPYGNLSGKLRICAN